MLGNGGFTRANRGPRLHLPAERARAGDRENPAPMTWALLLRKRLVAGLLAAAAATTATQAASPIVAERLRADERLRLDGTLSHPAWQRARPHDDFVEKAPDTGAAPREATRVRVLFDEQAIWVGIEAFDREPAAIRDFRVRHDGVNRTQDFVVVYLDAVGKRSAAQWFRVNAAGSTADGLHTAADDSEDFSPDFDWDAAVTRQVADNTRGGWTAVLRIPFASLRFSEGRQDWRIMVGRRLPREQFHLFSSVLIPRNAASFIATMQPLQGVELPADHAFLTVRPGLTWRRSDDGRGPKRQDHEASLDLKWRPRAELVIDGTLNPDFSQVELDVPQLAGNSRFALFLSEKRPFFFESADLLRMPTDALYTRSVTAPKGGLRATWRGTAWAGTAFALQDRGGGLVLLPGPYGTDAAEQPAGSLLALRARHDDGQGSFGWLAANRRYNGGGDRGSNTVLGPDIGLPLPALPGGAWRLRAQWLHARTDAQPDGRGGLARGAAVDGDLVRLKLLRQAERGETALTVDDISDGFRHDSGFVAQAGARRVELFHNHAWRGDFGPLNEVYATIEVIRAQRRQDGTLIEDSVRPGVFVTGARNFEGWIEWYGQARVRLGPGLPLLPQRYWSVGLVMTPAPWMPLLDLSADLGRLADTAVGPAGEVRRGGRVSGSARLRPLAALELEPRLNLAWLERDGERRYRESAGQLLAIWHLDARHSLRLIAQHRTLWRAAEPTVAPVDEAGRTASLTYAWRRSAGTRLYVGAGREQPRGQPAANELFVKLELDAGELWR